MSINPRS